MTGRFDSRIRTANGRLKRDGYRIKIERRGINLSLRGNLPPDIARGQTLWSHRRIPLGIRVSPEGIAQAEKHARQVGRALLDNSFQWDDWGQGLSSKRRVSDWVKAYEQTYWQRRQKNKRSLTTWRCDYQRPFDLLPEDAKLTTDLLINILIAKTEPDSRSRKRHYRAFLKLAQSAELDISDLEGLGGDYGPAKTKPLRIPTATEIRQWYSKIPNEKWQRVYGVIAAYGLRPHEALMCEFREYGSPKLDVLDGKTGPRVTLPYPVSWATGWRLWEGTFPTCNAKNFSDTGHRVVTQFYRYGIPFPPLAMRHFHALALMKTKKLSLKAMAESMGHSPKVFLDTYQKWYSEEELEEEWKRLEIDRLEV